MNLLVTRLYMDMINDFVTGAIEGFFNKLGEFIEFLLDFHALKGFFAKIRSVQALVPTEIVAEYSEESLEQEVLEFYDPDQDEVEEENSYYTNEDIALTPVQSKMSP